MAKHKVFISFHHTNDQWYKDELCKFNDKYDIFIDESVYDGDIDDENMTDQEIRKAIRDKNLRNSTVTILLVGTETQYRKHIDWELYSSMYDAPINHRSGILVIMLPSTGCKCTYAGHDGESSDVLSGTDWYSKYLISSYVDYRNKYPYLPDRIIKNLMNGAKISIINWNEVTVGKLTKLIDNAYNDKDNTTYVFPEMRRKNYNPQKINNL